MGTSVNIPELHLTDMSKSLLSRHDSVNVTLHEYDSLDVLQVKEHSYFTSGSESNHQKDQRKAVRVGHSNLTTRTHRKKKKSQIVNKPALGFEVNFTLPTHTEKLHFG